MYISRIEVTESIAQHSQLGRVLKDQSYSMHRLLWDLFDLNNRVLFREESSREQLGTKRNLPLYYVLSMHPPKSESPIFNVETKPFTPAVKEGELLSFRLRANPTVAKKDGQSKHSKRHDVVMDAQRQWLHSACQERNLSIEGKKGDLRRRLLKHQDFIGSCGEQKLIKELREVTQKSAHEWLRSRGSKNGFDLEKVVETSYRWHALPNKNRKAGFSSLDYEGLLRVTNPEQFKEMLTKGLGPSKAFGCGLMLVRRI